MALERFTGALASVNAGLTRHVVGNAGTLFGCTSKVLQKALPANVSKIVTTVLFVATSGGALCLANKIWKNLNAPVAAPALAAAPAAADGDIAAALPVAPVAPSVYTRYLKVTAAAGLVFTATIVNFGLAGVYRGGATPLAWLAGAGTVAFASRGYLKAQAIALYNKCKGPALSAAEAAVKQAENDIATTERAIKGFQADIGQLEAKVSDAAKAAITQLLADEQAAKAALATAVAAAAARWKINFWSNDSKVITAANVAVADSVVLTTKTPEIQEQLKDADASRLWKARQALVTAQDELKVKTTVKEKAVAEAAKKTV